MNPPITAWQVGAATVRIFNLGTLQVDLSAWFTIPQEQLPAAYAAAMAAPILIPAQCLHVALPGMSLLVDACDAAGIAHSSFAPPNYQPPPDLLTQMQSAGIAPESVTHVVITHPHFDHISGLTREHDGQMAPCFPNARHYLGRADDAQIHKLMHDPRSLESRTLGVVQQHGLLELADAQHDINSSVAIIATPGETPGHQIVRVRSEGQTLYYLGDLYHHQIEFAYPDVMVPWADVAATEQSRAMLAAAALAEDARLIATHIAGVGRLRQTHKGVMWQSAE